MNPSAARLRRALAVAVGAAVLTAALAASGCGRASASPTQLTVSGSTTILPIAEVAREMFEARHPGVTVQLSAKGSSPGIEDVSSGKADIGTSSRDLKGQELALGLFDTPIAHDAIAVIVNPANPVKGLTKAQVASIFEGRITNWSEVGGKDMPIGVVNRDEASGTREAFWKIVLDKRPFDPTAAVLPGTGQVRFVVAESPGAIGYISLGFVDKTVKALAVDGVAPAEGSIRSGRYPIARLLHFFTRGRPTGLAAEFTRFVLSDEVQNKVVRDAGFLPMKEGR